MTKQEYILISKETIEPLYISVDIETSGPVPGIYSMLSIGACVVGDFEVQFYRELKPVTMQFQQEALDVTGFDLKNLNRGGHNPLDTMIEFSSWVNNQCRENKKPIFVGFNAAFDWSFINYYFHLYCHNNPFGYSALDIKSFFMCLQKCAWDEARSSKAAQIYNISKKDKHNAVEDAVFQAKIFASMLNAAKLN